MRNKKANVSKLLVLLVLLTGMFSLMSCTSVKRTPLGRFTIVSTKMVDLSRVATFKKSKSQDFDVDSYKKKSVFLNISDDLTLEDAISKAIDHVPGGVALVDAVIKETKTVKKGFFTKKRYNGYYITGSVLIDPKVVAVDENDNKVYVGVVTKDMVKVEYIEN